MVFLLPYNFFVQSHTYVCIYNHTLMYVSKSQCIILYIFFYYYYFFKFIYFWLCWVFTASHGLSLVVASRGYSLVEVYRLLFAVASLILDHGSRVRGLSSCSTQA